MNQSKKNYYSSISNLPVENFYLLNKHNDLRYLIRGFEEDDERELTDDEMTDLESTRSSIMEDYVDGLSDGKGRSDLLIVGQIGDIEVEIMIVGSLLTMLHFNPTDELKLALKEWKYPENLEKARKKLDSVKFRLSILKSQNKHLFVKPESDEEIEYDLYKDVVLLEQALGGKEINPKTTVLDKWINYMKYAKDKNKKKK